MPTSDDDLPNESERRPADDGRGTRDVRDVPRKGFLRRHWLGATLLTIVVLPVAILFAWATATLGYSFSDGTRAGYNQKLSRRGWICKTWEGELAMTTSPGTAPQIFRYSVRSDSVARVIESLEGKQISLHYEQHKGVPTSCFGETEYFVTSVRAIGG
jgi:hypothetical protein